jgi:UDP:flavonoid glycosyltransferase YjiC (YdhE family)
LRLLLSCRHLTGHLHPLLPLAEAAAAREHEVAFATGEPALEEVRRRGFGAIDAGSFDGAREEFLRRFPGLGTLPPAEHRALFFRELFVGRELPVRLPVLLDVVGDFDLVVHEVVEPAAPLAATLAGRPYVTSGFGPLAPPAVYERAAAASAPHWRAHGLPPRGVFGPLYLDPCPAALQRPEISELTVTPIRLTPTAEPADGGAVYVTFGTVWNRDMELIRAVLAGLGHAEVVVTLGADGDPAALGPQPANVHVHRFLAQSEILPRCAAVVCHAGAGTMLGALAHGLPLLMLPQGADQHDNAERVAAAGAGLIVAPDGVAAGLARVEELRPAARRIAAELAALPAPERVVERLQGLAHRR